MEEIDLMKNIFNDKNEFVKSTNFYFQNHDCDGKTKKVDMVYSIENRDAQSVIIFGKCDTCNKVFYNKDYK